MNDDVRTPIDEPLYPPAGRGRFALPPILAALPVGTFTASVLFDVLSLVAESPEQARSYHRGAVELLKAGIGASFAGLALGLLDALRVPAASPAGKLATKHVALDGAVVAIYLLNVAAREKHLAEGASKGPALDPVPIGLSLAGLAVLGAAGKLK